MKPSRVIKAVGPEVIEAYRQGRGLKQLATEVGIAPVTLQLRLVEAGCEIRHRWQRPKGPEDDEILRRYNAGKTIEGIAHAIGRSFSFVQKSLWRFGTGSLRRRERSLEIDPEEAIRRYRAGHSIMQIAEGTDSKWSAVRDTLKDQGVVLRRRGVQRTYPIHESFFDPPLSEESAYWVGFILADGCVYIPQHGEPRVQIGIGIEADAPHLERFLAVVSPGRPLHRTSRSNRPLFIATVPSRRLADALAHWGITPRKSATATPSDDLDRQDAAFWRGVLDGDGGIYLYPKREAVSVHLHGSRPTVEAFRRWAMSTASRPVSKAAPVKHAPTCWQIHLDGSHLPIAILRALYQDATVYLPRKYRLWQQAERKLAHKLATSSPRIFRPCPTGTSKEAASCPATSTA